MQIRAAGSRQTPAPEARMTVGPALFLVRGEYRYRGGQTDRTMHHSDPRQALPAGKALFFEPWSTRSCLVVLQDFPDFSRSSGPHRVFMGFFYYPFPIFIPKTIFDNICYSLIVNG
jgi:hypothetical protein